MENLPRPAVGADGRQVSQAAIDEDAIFSGSPFEFQIANDNVYARWYRVFVTDLKKDEYVVYTPDGILDEDALVELGSGQSVVFTVVPGGESAKEPDGPRKFEIRVLEFPVADENAKSELIASLEKIWLPTPEARDVRLEAQPSAPAEIVVRPYPWMRKAKFRLAVSNHGFVPADVTLHVGPSNEEEVSEDPGRPSSWRVEDLGAPLPPQKKCSQVSEYPSSGSLKEPVDLHAYAVVRAAGAPGPYRVAAPSYVRIVPVKFLKVWYDWLVVALGAFLLIWLLFGMPPWSHPTAVVKLHFDPPLADSVRPEQMQVQLVPIGQGGRIVPMNGRLAPGWNRSDITYTFDWGWGLRPFRWTWKPGDMKVDVKSGAVGLAEYDLLAAQDERIEINTNGHIARTNIPVPIGMKGGVTLLPELRNVPSDATNINITYLVSGKPIASETVLRGQAPRSQRLAAEHFPGGNPADVVVTAKVLPGNDEVSNTVPGAKPGEQAYPVLLQFGARTATLSIPSAKSPTPFQYRVVDAATGQTLANGGSNGGAKPVPIRLETAKRQVTASVTVNGKEAKSNTFDLEPGKTTQFGDWEVVELAKPPDDIKPFDPNKIIQNGGVVKPPVAPVKGLDAKLVRSWTDPLDIREAAGNLVEASRDPGALRVTVETSDWEKVIVTVSDDAYAQLYLVNRSFEGGFEEQYAGGSAQTKGDRSVARPWSFSAKDSRSISIGVAPGDRVVVLAWRKGVGKLDTDFQEPLRAVRNAGRNLKDWAINGIRR